MYYIQGSGGSAGWAAPAQFVAGSYDCSVNVRWSRYNLVQPGSPDILYWNQAYPNELFYGGPGAASVDIGAGYSDGTMHQIVRTSGNRVYTICPNCDSYPDFSTNGLTQTIRVMKANAAGTPASFARQDSANEPAAVVGCAAAIDGSDVIHIAWEARDAINRTHYLRYAQFNTATDTWGSVTSILSNVDYDDFGQGDENIALALDANGKVHIAFLSTNGSGVLADRRVWYTNNVSGSWAAAVQVDSDVTYTGDFKAWHPGLIFDVNGKRVFSWVKGTFDNVSVEGDGTLYVRTRETNDAWNTSVGVDTPIECGIDQCAAVLVSAGNRYHLGYSGPKNQGNGFQQMRYQYSDDAGASWSANHPSPIFKTHNTTIGLGV